MPTKTLRGSPTHLRAQCGFSIVELMVALGLSMLLLMGVVAMFVSSRTNYETTERLSRIQENGRYALDQLSSSIREAGFQGCTRSLSLTGTGALAYQISTLNPANILWQFQNPVQGFQSNGNGTWTPVITPITGLGLAPNVVSDVLVLRRVPRRDSIPLRLGAAQASSTAPLTVPAVAGSDLRSGDVVMISDCDARAYFQVTNYSGGVITYTATGKNATADLLHPFRLGAEIVPVETVIYFVAPVRGQLSLWRQTNGNMVEELAEGIERMEVQYGEDTTGNSRVDRYVTANTVADWGNVISVRIALLARSPEEYGTERDPEIYTLLEQTLPAFNDRHQRQIFTTTIALRNQVFD